LTNKLEALDQANSDLQNLFESTDVATVFLDKSLRIRSFTPAIAKIFNILPTDRGRPVTDFSSSVVLPGLADEIKRVLSEPQSIERPVESTDGSNHFLLRLAPYHANEQYRALC
jgi:two-component system CheB/CheR fusion protein